MLRRPYDRDFALLERCQFPREAIFVDVGANRGEAIDAMRIFHPYRRIVAFEPNRFLASRLSRTYASDRAIEIVACGLGAEHAELELMFPSYNNWDFDALASFKYDPDSLSEKDITAEYLKPGPSGEKMRDGALDAYFFVGGFPAGAITELAASTAITLVPVSGPEAEKLIADNQFFAANTVPAETYKGVLPFLASYAIRVLLLLAFPALSLWLVRMMG